MKRIILNPNDFIPDYLAGETIQQIACRYNVSRKVIRKYLINSGIEIRPQGYYIRLRWQQMTPKERELQVSAAHRAALGRTMTTMDLAKAAIGRQRKLSGISDTEKIVAKLLTDRGCAFIQQFAIGPYNCDIAIPPVAVEVFGGAWHWYGQHINRLAKRFRYIMNQGWHILVVTDYGGVAINEATADYIISYVQSARRNPANIREYRVIRGAGQFMAGDSINDDEISIVPTFTARRNALGQYETVPR